MKNVAYREMKTASPVYWTVLVVLGAILLVGLAAAHYMETEGHWVTGMTNQIVWGMPHVFAVFLIVAASGALNVASIASVFGKTPYKPLSRLSGLLAVTLLVGGLAILVLDLGRPDRLIVAMTYYNFKSIFAWNIFLYTGFMAIVAAYLWTMMERNRQVTAQSGKVGLFAFLWRLILTTGTGSIFGFLVAREAYDAAIMAPMFILMSFSYGLAIYILTLMVLFKWGGRPLSDDLLYRLKNLLGVFIAGVLYFVLAYHLTNLYITERHGVEAFLLNGQSVISQIFWVGQILLGSLVPLALLYSAAGRARAGIVLASLLVILGGFAQMYVTIIGGQAYPLVIFPGYEVSSSFFDGVISHYAPSIYEVALGIGGVAIAALGTLVVARMLPILPVSLGESEVMQGAASASPAQPAQAAA